MTIESTLTILMFALAPYAWWLVVGTCAFIALHFVAYLRGYQVTQYRCLIATALAALTGLSAVWWIPILTHSRLSYVATLVDWIALIGAIAAIFFLAFLVLHPLSFLVRERT